MTYVGKRVGEYASKSLLLYPAIVVLLLHPLSAAVVPYSNCYAIDNSSRLIDFTDWIGYTFEYNGEDADLVIRFCKDVESRSQAGYIDFGRYSYSNHFVKSSGPVNFVQKYYGGDLAKCEYTFDKMGRSTQVNIICGSCLHGTCKGEHGCICGVTYDPAMCRAFVELSIPCHAGGSRIFEGFTVGFHPRTWEIVYNGLTMQGFEKSLSDFRFETEQTHVSLYLTAISSLSSLVGMPTFMVNPTNGLDVKLSGTAANGYPPTTLSPSILEIEWICENSLIDPYEVAISIPIIGYDPIEFSLSKICEYAQESEGGVSNGWASFGVISCVLITLATLFCCGGFIYKVNVEQQHGLDALPGITILSACLEAVSGPQPQGYEEQDLNGPHGYAQQDDESAFFNQAQSSRDKSSISAKQGAQRGLYGSI